ncbi:DUF2190 family protein [Algiphilus sp.]|uniref:DUF2190 family protein n=1 Tax=Algiphilus sp. TaxID=1872431 RepID=UPI0025C6907A|nr:DUF2190 family protein [Algiphilus sp.]MCK5770933.1 DUF2190 family protein [Algiphilus sp.]
MKNQHKIHGGEIVAPAPAQVASGGVALFSAILGVAVGAYESGELGVFKTHGQDTLPKVEADDMSTVGEMLFWDVSEGAFSNGTAEAGDIENCAYVAEPADDTVTTVTVELCPGLGTVAQA